MLPEQFKNDAQTTLSAGINSTTTSVTVNAYPSGTFPSSGNFRILVDSELMLVTGVSGDTFTVVRGNESPAAAHDFMATVTLVLTAGSLTTAFVRADETTVQAGISSSASGNYAIAIGGGASAPDSGSIAIGANASASYNGASAIGGNASASQGNSSAFGTSATASEVNSTASGYYAQATGVSSTANGCYTLASGGSSTAIGAHSTASASGSIAIGAYTTASGYNSLAIGSNASATGSHSVAIGHSSSASAYQVVIGTGGANGGELKFGHVTAGLSATVYSGDNLVDNGLASVVGRLASTGNTSNISGTIFTPASSGMYRVSIYMLTTTAGSGSVLATIGWTDPIKSQPFPLSSALDLSAAGNIVQESIYICAENATAITYSTSLSGSGTYSVYIHVERLS